MQYALLFMFLVGLNIGGVQGDVLCDNAGHDCFGPFTGATVACNGGTSCEGLSFTDCFVTCSAPGHACHGSLFIGGTVHCATGACHDVHFQSTVVSCETHGCDDANLGDGAKITCSDVNSCGGVLYDSSSCCVQGDYCPAGISICSTPKHVQGDPAVFGLRGQFFHFEAADGWYSGVSEPHLQWNWRLTQFTGKTSNSKQDYITGEALTFYDDNGSIQQKLLMEFMDVSKPSQGCIGGLKTPCLHRGNLKVAIGDKIITEAGEYDLFEGAKLYAINAPLDCSRMEGHLHEFEEKRAADKRRKLSNVNDAFEIFTATTDVSGPDCARWLDLGRQKGTIYGAEYQTTIIITTPRFMIRFEFRENAKEQWMWVDHSLMKGWEDVNEVWSGIHGETKQAHYDSEGVEIMEGRKVLKGKDVDYLVKGGAFGREFAARIV